MSDTIIFTPDIIIIFFLLQQLNNYVNGMNELDKTNKIKLTLGCFKKLPNLKVALSYPSISSLCGPQNENVWTPPVEERQTINIAVVLSFILPNVSWGLLELRTQKQSAESQKK